MKKIKRDEVIEALKSNKARLNHPCSKCKEIIYIGDSCFFNEKPYHTNCVFELGKQKQKKKDVKMFEKMIDEFIEIKYITGNGIVWLEELKQKLKEMK